MNTCSCGVCANCKGAALGNAATPQFGNGGTMPPPSQLTWEQFQSGQPASQPIMTHGAPPMQPIQQTAPISEPVGTPNIPDASIETPPVQDEWVFIDMTPWKILFWSIDEPIIEPSI